jgi:hypothetical protein
MHLTHYPARCAGLAAALASPPRWPRAALASRRGGLAAALASPPRRPARQRSDRESTRGAIRRSAPAVVLLV